MVLFQYVISVIVLFDKKFVRLKFSCLIMFFSGKPCGTFCKLHFEQTSPLNSHFLSLYLVVLTLNFWLYCISLYKNWKVISDCSLNVKCNTIVF